MIVFKGNFSTCLNCIKVGNFEFQHLILKQIIQRLSILIDKKSWIKVGQWINSILLHSGLNPAWHFWLSTRFSCCLKMKSVENILWCIGEQFYRFSRGCKPRENLWNCSRKYTKMFKTDSFLGNKNIEFQSKC